MKNFKRFIVIILAICAVMVCASCKKCSKDKNRLIPTLSDPTGTYLKIGNYTITKKDVYYQLLNSYGTEVFLAKDGVLIGAIVIADTLKDDAKSAIASLKAQNLHTVMLTGDSETTANAIAKETGIDEVHAKLLPQDKLSELKKIRENQFSITIFKVFFNTFFDINQSSQCRSN